MSASALVFEAEHLEVGAEALVDEEVTLFGHTFQRGVLEFATNRIGRRAEVGALSVILPGGTVGADVTALPLTQLLGGERLLDNCAYGGSPAEYLGPSRSQQEVSASDGLLRIQRRGCAGAENGAA